MLVLGFTLLIEQAEQFICISPTSSQFWQDITRKSSGFENMSIYGCWHILNFEGPLMNCRKLSLTIQQSMLGGERDRIVPSHDLSNQEGPLLQAFRKLRKETKEALKKQVQITKSTVIIQIHDHLNLRAILITSAKELSNFLKSFIFFGLIIWLF